MTIDLSKIKKLPKAKTRGGHNTKPIIQFDLDGNPINVFKNIKIAIEKNKWSGKATSKYANISQSVRKDSKSKTAYGFQWKYLEDHVQDKKILKEILKQLEAENETI